ncbi:Probable E3 ubiquitin-protein ligase HERC3 (HECT domain and RCC1-like domain-containing protein 3) (HECT-type E3 ubiquitin transferase HERC3) [Durusdinium trenchii]|uniref:Probable E3 ubiquitin-protein ligase HERC3 (HECT domain and RCC1-like domain-containing protein 3) (HECT-type E3 ubiquitin transferase HERC3) n=1 Tax=Durusdinium trenchii TaxID=1381693 RepID=A0ABP0JES0_9DINO
MGTQDKGDDKRRSSVGKNPLKVLSRLSARFRHASPTSGGNGREKKDMLRESQRLDAAYQGLDAEGTKVYAWGGRPGSGPLFADDAQDFVLEPVLANGLSERRIVSVAASKLHAIAVSDDGQVYGMGNNEDGQLHSELDEHAFRAGLKLIDEAILFNKRVIQVSCGSGHSALLTSDGFVVTYGLNDSGQLGHSRDRVPYRVPPRIVQNMGRESAIQVACANNSTFILTSRGKVLSFGLGMNGVLGLGDEENRSEPKLVRGALEGNPVVQIAAGAMHCCAVTVTGRVYAWGLNKHGQLGLPDDVEREQLLQPVRVGLSRTVRSASCGVKHSVFVTEAGVVYACGKNSKGQLGLPGKPRAKVSPPRVVEALKDFESPALQAACGEFHTVVLTEDGSVFTLGSLNGDAGDAAVPRQVEVGSGAFGLTAGGDSAFAITSEAAVLARRKSMFRAAHAAQRAIQWMTGGQLAERAETVLTVSGGGGNKRRSMRSLRRDLDLQLFDIYTLNASFLKDEFSSPNRSSPDKFDEKRNSGIQIDTMLRGMTALQDALLASMERRDAVKYLRSKVAPLVAQLDQAASVVTEPDQLRVYLVLFLVPFAHLIDKDHEILVYTLRKLPKRSLEMLLSWIKYDVPSDVFMTNLVKPLLAHLNTQLSYHRFDDMCEFYCKLLGQFHKINESRRNNTAFGFGMLPHTEFYSERLSAFREEDLGRLFEKWRMQLAARKTVQESERQFGRQMTSPATLRMAKEFTIFDYPFLLSADTKRRIMQIEDQATMFRNLLFSQLFMNSPYFVMNVHRDNLLEDTIRILSTVEKQELKKPLRVKFDGEEGLDAGGVRKEFFQLLSAQLFNPDYGMFIEYGDTDTIWFNPTDPALDAERSSEIILVGTLIGLAIYNSTLLDVRFPLVMYRMLLGKMPDEPGLDILEELDPEYAKNLRFLRDYDGDDFEDLFMQNFEVSTTVFGETKQVELKPGGSEIAVTKANREEYIALLVKYLVVDSVKTYASALVAGFNKVIPNGLASLSLFLPDELELTATGSPELDFDALESIATYEGGYSADHPVVKAFWKIVHDFDHETKEAFLRFTTGSPKAPVGGLRTVSFKIQRAGPDSDQLPTAHTCFNTLMLPDYASRDGLTTEQRLKERLTLALEVGSQGFGLE